MANNYVTISNTGNIGGGAKLIVMYGTWKVMQPDYDFFIGLDGSASVGIGSDTNKKRWEFVGRCQLVGATGYASLTGAGQSVINWATSQTPAERLLKMTDIYAVTYDVLWVGPYAPMPITGDTAGNGEWYKVPVKLVQQ